MSSPKATCEKYDRWMWSMTRHQVVEMDTKYLRLYVNVSSWLFPLHFDSILYRPVSTNFFFRFALSEMTSTWKNIIINLFCTIKQTKTLISQQYQKSCFNTVGIVVGHNVSRKFEFTVLILFVLLGGIMFVIYGEARLQWKLYFSRYL